MASARLVAPAACSAADLQTDRTASFLHVPLFPKALWPGWTGRVAPLLMLRALRARERPPVLPVATRGTIADYAAQDMPRRGRRPVWTGSCCALTVLQHSKKFCCIFVLIEDLAGAGRRDIHSGCLSRFAGQRNRTALICFKRAFSPVIGEPERRGL